MSIQDIGDGGQFDTYNLQAEIKRNIEEIMQASKVEEISGNMEALKELVEDIPQLKIEQPVNEDKFSTKKIDEELKSRFQEYLSEENDGQISILEAGHEGGYDQIEGQLTIEEVSMRWERTRRAAKQALLEAKEQELIHYKQEALEKANKLLDKLLETGEKARAGFPIPVLSAGGNVVSGEFNIPIIQQDKNKNEIADVSQEQEIIERLELEEQESDSEHVQENSSEEDALKSAAQEDLLAAEDSEHGAGMEAAEQPPEEKQDEEYLLDSEYAILDPQFYEEEEEVDFKEKTPEDTDSNEFVKAESTQDLSPEETLKSINDMLQGEIDRLTREQNTTVEMLASVPKQDIEVLSEGDRYSEEEIASLPEDEPAELSGEERKLLSYFAGITGMESHIVNALAAAKSGLFTGGAISFGHIIIQGRRGSGKTRLAQNIIKVLQSQTGKPEGNIGKISAEKLNEKDVGTVVDKIGGGVLIIENAGALSNDSVMSLSISIEGDTKGTLIILEDSREEISGLLKRYPRFAKKFSEPISIPVMTIDELVNFGKLYAAESGYIIDEMGILALYDRVNIMSTPTSPATVLDIKVLLDNAIALANKTRFKRLFGIFKSKSDDESGLKVLQERDFRED